MGFFSNLFSGEDERNKIRDILNEINRDFDGNYNPFSFLFLLDLEETSFSLFDLADTITRGYTPSGWTDYGNPSDTKQNIANDILKILVSKGRRIQYIAKDASLKILFKKVVDGIYHEYNGNLESEEKRRKIREAILKKTK